MQAQLITRLESLHAHYGREDSFKLGPRTIIAERILIGVNTNTMASARLLAIASELGMPDDCLAVLLPQAGDANVVFFGFEQQADCCICKVYLELWDQLRRTTRRTGSQAPQLLHLGVKWDSARPDRHAVARYDCHPLLDTRAILRRMAACYGDPASPVLCALAQAIVLQAAQNQPGASMLYLEVNEAGNARASFDINLYKSGMLVADASAQLHQAGDYFGLDAAVIDAQLARLGACPLGHLSSGLDRHGQPFLTVYGETVAI
ncbi:MAG: hypothetical protein V4484_03245 [Pseudomonadota bacterium]